MGKSKHDKIEFLMKQVQVRDKLIGGLLHEIASAGIKLPEHLLGVIGVLYSDKIIKDGDKEEKTGE